MRVSGSWADWHWPHLLLLALLYPAFWLGAAQPLWLLPGWLLLNVAVLALAEWRRPQRLDWRPTGADLGRDGRVLALNVVTEHLLTAALSALAVALAPPASALPIAVQLLLGAALAELGSYALHRASHRGGWLWRVHVLHHRPQRLHLANALTAHPLNAVYDQIARQLPLLLIGLSAPVLLALSLFHLTQSLVAHANVRGRFGALNWLLGSAELHRLHHSTEAGEAGNFGTDLPWWDLLFGTYRRAPCPREVGVFEPARYPGEHELAALLVLPFSADKHVAGPSPWRDTPAA